MISRTDPHDPGCDRLAKCRQMMLQMHLNHVKNGPTFFCRRSCIDVCGHSGRGTRKGYIPSGYIRDAIDCSWCHPADADLFDFYHNCYLISFDKYLIITNKLITSLYPYPIQALLRFNPRQCQHFKLGYTLGTPWVHLGYTLGRVCEIRHKSIKNPWNRKGKSVFSTN